MNSKNIVLLVVVFFTNLLLVAQETAIYTNPLKDYNHAMELYQNKSYVAAQLQFNDIKSNFDDDSELKANCDYYAANCAVRLGQPNADELMQQFVDNYPTSIKRNSAFIDVANYYFNTGNYAYAAKWYGKVNTANLTISQEEEFNFNYGYSLFASKNYTGAKTYFLMLLDSQKYGAQAKYYYGFIAYNQDDYETAGKYLGEVENNASFKTDVSYYLADMNFKLGNFDKAIEYGLPILEKSRGEEHSEISKIIGESYFNLEKYQEAIPYLKNYKGKNGKFNNTDYYFLGYAYFKQQNFNTAISFFNKIIDGNNAVAQNAYYHLAECYLELAEKQAALNAFRNAAQMPYDAEIQKDAWLNYAKLSYDIGNPYKSVPDVLTEYLNLYPNSPNKTEINDLIISSYVSSNNYQGALDLLKGKKTPKDLALYQKVSFYQGIDFFNNQKYALAKESFNNSLSVTADGLITAQATFWLGESNYRLENFSSAINNFKAFSTNPNASKTPDFTILNYNLGYAYFKQKEYTLAIDAFKSFLQKNSNDALRTNDSYLRIADSYFASSNYKSAIEFYNNALKMNGIDADYAQFQKAICYGLTGNENEKINELNLFLKNYKKSIYTDDAYFVLGNSYIKTGNNKMALESFDYLISNFNQSPLVSQALLKKGLIYYNTDKNEQALNTYKTVVTRFPNTAEANQAVQNIRQIYVDLGRVDEYATWVKKVDFVSVSDAELDNDMYESAEKQYLQNNPKKAIPAFKKYLESFPKGIHILNANFYLAQSLFSNNEQLETIPYYTYVVKQDPNEFTETALERLSVVYLETSNWSVAIPLLERLENSADLPQNITFAQSNLMKGYYEEKKYEKAVNYADLILQNPKLNANIQSDAYIIIARSAMKTGNEEKARTAYAEVEKIASGELKAEALFYNAYFENKAGSYRVSNEIVQTIAADYAAYKYWAAKSLIVMATNYYELNDAYQATYILESVIKNFEQFKDVVEEATKELTKIKTEQAKTNESVKN
jgi:TolA-binding protein